MIKFIDTHCHLYGEEYIPDLDATIQRAKEVGVVHMMLPNINAATVEPMLQLAALHPDLFSPMIGLHPEEVKADWSSVLDKMEENLKNPAHPYVAVGEVGLDYYWDKTFYHEQIEAFEREIAWAETYQLPLMLHTRAAHREMMDCLKGHQLSGVFHCFSSSKEIAEEILTTFPRFSLGIGGILTFKNSHLPETLQAVVPLNRIVIETDAPYLAPTPYRGKRNESAYALEVVRKLSEIYGVSMEEVAEITTQNVLNTFPKVPSNQIF